MPYKLSYFDTRGLAEPTRLLFVDNGIDFEDHRFDDDAWEKIKDTMPFNVVPCLFDGELQIGQSGAIIRHIARKHNLAGNTESEAAYIDMFAEGLRDLHRQYTKMIYTDYENGKELFVNDILPAELAKFEKLLKTKENGEKYVVGEKVSYADYMLFEELDIQLILDPHCLKKFPGLAAFHKRFLIRPNLKVYLEKRASSNPDVNGNGKQ